MTVRTNNPTKVPGIPKPPSDVSPQLRRYLESISEALEIRLGRRGDVRDRAITLRELVDTGLAVDLANRPFDPNTPSTDFSAPETSSSGDVETPTAPTGVTGAGGYAVAQIYWTLPNYRGHSFTEIWRFDSDTIGNATLVGVSSGISFVDPIGEGLTRYYWLRHVNSNEEPGPFHASAGLAIATATDVAHILGILAGAITSSQLANALSTRIDLIDSPASVAGSVAAQVAAEATARATAISNEASARATAITSAIDDEVAARNSAISSAVATETTNRGTAITTAVNAEAAARATAITNEASARATAITNSANSLQSQINDIVGVSAYSGSTTYATNDLVTYSDSLYRAKQATTNNLPTNTTYWELIGDYDSLADVVSANQSAITQLNTVSTTSGSANARYCWTTGHGQRYNNRVSCYTLVAHDRLLNDCGYELRNHDCNDRSGSFYYLKQLRH